MVRGGEWTSFSGPAARQGSALSVACFDMGASVVRRLGAVCAGALLVSGCEPSGSVGGAEARPAGRLSLGRVAGGLQPGDAVSRATACGADSSVTVVAVGRVFSGGITLRAAPPLRGPREFRVLRGAGGDGTAVVAFRSLADSVGPSFVGVDGRVWLETAVPLRGHFEVEAEDEEGARFEFGGGFRDVPIVAHSVCRSGAAPP